MTYSLDPKKNRTFEQGESGKVRWDVVQYTRGMGFELGCGPVKLFPHFIGIDKEMSDPKLGPSLAMDCSELRGFSSDFYDFIFSSHLLEHIEDYEGALAEWWRVIKPGGYLVLYLPHKEHYPNIGEPGGNEDHKHDFLPIDIVRAMETLAIRMRDGRMPAGVELVVNQTRAQGDEYSFFQVYRKLEVGMGFRARDPRPAEKTAAVFRPGAYGDALFASSVLGHLKREGYHVTVYTEQAGAEIFEHDPHIDEMIVIGPKQVPDGFLTQYFEGVAPKYDRAINLIESVEKNGIAWPTDGRFLWPDAMRRKVFGGNYLEMIHDLAGVPHVYQQRFYASADELAAARTWRTEHCGDEPMVVISASGSTGPKFWPYLPQLTQRLAVSGVHAVVLGDLREMKLPDDPRIHAIGTQWPMRRAMTLALIADVVVGQETGLLNAVAMESMRKIVLLSHSTHENLTLHWENTKALVGHVPCYPCHRIHLDFAKCVRDEKTGTAACQAAIPMEEVAGEVLVTLKQRAGGVPAWNCPSCNLAFLGKDAPHLCVTTG